MCMDKSQLLVVVDKFISGDECSISMSNIIEVALDDLFPNDAEVQDVVEALASYRSGGGEYLYDERQVIMKLVRIREWLCTSDINNVRL
jgi:hypothetical protein